MPRELNLTDGWTVRPVTLADGAPPLPETLPAVVPGCIHTDLLDASLIADPYLDRNEELQHWVGDSAWEYRTSFDGPTLAADERASLEFDGLDTVATIRLNGAAIAQTANMHRRYQFDVTDQLRAGRNELCVEFAPVREYAFAVRDKVGVRPNAYDEPFQYVRKMACNFGWDWGPTLLTCGIWKPVRLVVWSGARLAEVRPSATLAGAVSVGQERAEGVLEVAVAVQTPDAGSGDRTPKGTDAAMTGMSVRAMVDGREIAHTAVSFDGAAPTAQLRGSVPNAPVWWPYELGTPALADLRVELLDAEGSVIDSYTTRTGFRTVSLDTAPDADGAAFVISINGQPMFIRGVNWIPDDCFVTRVDSARYRHRLDQSIAAHCNLIRIWGGGLYETKEFYEQCDELGLLVWQDFLFACAAYPEDEPLASEVEAEARDNVARLAPHPSLILWNGCNENIWGYFDWGWPEVLEGRTWGLGYYLETLPRVVAELDPHRPYWPGSPYSGSMDIHPDDPNHNNMHIWTVWNDLTYDHYRDQAPRFVSEFGYQAPPNFATIERSIHDQPLIPDSPGMLQHQKAFDGQAKLIRGMAPFLPEPHDFDDWHYLTQVNQAHAIDYGISYFRSLAPRCMGEIVWQINDCWPVTSWAAVDGDGRLKPLWYAMRRAQAPRFITIEDKEGQLTAVALNDSPTPWREEFTVSRVSLEGEVLAQQAIELEVAPMSRRDVALSGQVVTPEDPSSELLRVRRSSVARETTAAAGVEASRFDDAEQAGFIAATERVALPAAAPSDRFRAFVPSKDLATSPAEYVAVVEALDDGVAVTLNAVSALLDVTLNADRIDPDAVVSDQLVTLLPGERYTFTVRTTAPADDPRWTTKPVLRCLNDLN